MDLFLFRQAPVTARCGKARRGRPSGAGDEAGWRGTLRISRRQDPLLREGNGGLGLWKVPVGGGEETLVLEQLGCGLLTMEPDGEGIYFYNASTTDIEFFSFATHKTTQIAKLETHLTPASRSPLTAAGFSTPS